MMSRVHRNAATIWLAMYCSAVVLWQGAYGAECTYAPYTIVELSCESKAAHTVVGDLMVVGKLNAAGERMVVIEATIGSTGTLGHIFDVVNGGNLTLKNLILKGGVATAVSELDPDSGYGGIVRVVSKQTAAVAARPTFFTATNCLFRDGTAQLGGGGIYLSGASTIGLLQAVSFNGNRASSEWGRGGAINLNNGAVLQMEQYPFGSSTIENNEAGHDGGGMCIWGGARLTVAGVPTVAHVPFLANVGTPTDFVLRIRNNKAILHGGAIAFEGAQKSQLRGVHFEGNEVSYYGGGISVISTVVVVGLSSFLSNVATHSQYSKGGAAYIGTDGALTLIRSTFSDQVTGVNDNKCIYQGLSGHSVAISQEALLYDTIDLPRFPYGVTNGPGLNNHVVLMASKLDSSMKAVEVYQYSPPKSCADTPDICTANGMGNPCFFNVTGYKYSVECACLPGSMRSRTFGCLTCPISSYSVQMDAPKCTPCTDYALVEGSSSCSAIIEEVVNAAPSKLSWERFSSAVFMSWGLTYLHLQ